MARGRKQQHLVGATLREYRHGRGLTLEAVSKAVGISTGFLSLVENDKTDITFSRLSTLANFYEIDLHSLLPPQAPAPVVFTRRGAHPHRIRSASEQVEFAFIAPDSRHAMVPLMVTIEPGGHWGEPSRHAGQEIAFMVEGICTAVVDGQVYTLEVGDTLYFDAMVPHSYLNSGAVPARLLCVMNAAWPKAEVAQPHNAGALQPG